MRQFIASAIAGSTLLSACVTTDPKVATVLPTAAIPNALNGTWGCNPTYTSHVRHGLLPSSIGSDNMAEAFEGTDAAPDFRRCDTATLTFQATPKLVITYHVDGHGPQVRELSTNQGLRVAASGMVELASTSCESGLAIGCVHDSLRLFVDGKGQLVIVTGSSGAAVALLVIPAIGSDTRMATFAPVSSE